jgi:uncharacterized membrane protein YebE (DUF533 family)
MPLIRGLARTAAIAGTATAVSNRVSRRQAGRWSRHEEQQYEQAPQQAPAPQAAPAPAPQTSNTDAMIAQLRQLADLHKDGVLDDAEFEVQKHKILNS